jgi:hypothetical protein
VRVYESSDKRKERRQYQTSTLSRKGPKVEFSGRVKGLCEEREGVTREMGLRERVCKKSVASG